MKFSNKFSAHVTKGGVVRELPPCPNGMSEEALNYVLETALNAGVQEQDWYIGLIDAENFDGLYPTDTLASHPTWQEYTGYTQGARPDWVKVITGSTAVNPLSAIFSFSEEASIVGFFIASENTKGGTTGTLWATALLDQVEDFSAGEDLNVTYEVKVG